MVLPLILLNGCVGTYRDSGESFMLAAGMLVSEAELNSKASGMCYSRGYSYYTLVDAKRNGAHKQLTYQCSKQSPNPTPQLSNQQPIQQSSTSSLEDAKKKCVDLGFKTGTDGFGNCVLKLTK